MKNLMLKWLAALAFFILILIASTAGAAIPRTYVSISGIDANPCTRIKPRVGVKADFVGSVIHVANSTITNNRVGFSVTGGGQILSRSPVTNTVLGNGSGENFHQVLRAK